MEHSCILGADGYAMDSTFGDYEADNTDCDDLIGGTSLSAHSLVKSGQIPATPRSAWSPRVEYNHLGLILFGSLGVAVLFGVWALCISELKLRLKGSASLSKMTMMSTEQDPLLQSL